MKRSLSYFFVSIALVAVVVMTTVSQEAENKSDLKGTWKLEKAKYEENASLEDATQDNYKTFTKDKLFVIALNGKNVERTHGGTYEFDGKRLSEKIEFASETMQDLIDQTFTFDLEINGDQLIQKSAEGSAFPNLEEHWKRVE